MNVPLFDEVEAKAAGSKISRHWTSKQLQDFKSASFYFRTEQTTIFIKAGFIKEIASF